MKMKSGYSYSIILSALLAAALTHPFASGAQPVTGIASGMDYSLYVKSDGSLWGMGNNDSGELGDGNYGPGGASNLSTNPPPQMILANNVTTVAVGGFPYSLIIKNDGSVWGTGNNQFGQLGATTNEWTNLPGQIMSNNVTAAAAGGAHSLFLKSDGSLWGVGRNNFGQLGDGTTNNTSIPEQIVAMNVTAISAGFDHTLFLKQDGSLWGMGWNSWGQLGDGTTNNVSIPEQIVAGGVAAISAYGSNSLFLKVDGSLWGMGCNAFGQLGDGTTNSTSVPEQIIASNVLTFACSGDQTYFIKNDHSLWGMGANEKGQLLQLGSYVTGIYTKFTNRPGLLVASGVVSVIGGGEHTLFLDGNGSLWGMGDSLWGELGATNNYPNLGPLEIVQVTPAHYRQLDGPTMINGQAVFSMAGITSAKYALEHSSSLPFPKLLFSSDPSAITTNRADINGLVLFTNTPTPGANNFWRVRYVP